MTALLVPPIVVSDLGDLMVYADIEDACLGLETSGVNDMDIRDSRGTYLLAVIENYNVVDFVRDASRVPDEVDLRTRLIGYIQGGLTDIDESFEPSDWDTDDLLDLVYFYQRTPPERMDLAGWIRRVCGWFRNHNAQQVSSLVVVPTSAQHGNVYDIVRMVLTFCRPDQGSFETDFPWAAEESWPPEVAAAAERLCGRESHYAQSGLRDLATCAEQEWDDFVAIAPFAYDATLFDESFQRVVSLADESESIVVSLSRSQAAQLRRALRGVAVLRRT